MKNAIIVFLFVLVILIAAHNIITRIALEQGVRIATGLKLDIAKLDVRFVKPAVTIQDLKLYNPAGYTDPLMADVPYIYCSYKPVEILKGKIYLKQFRLSLRELFIIRRSGNELNFDAFNGFQARGNGAPRPLTIDDFDLIVGRVIYKDYTHLPKPLVKIYNLNLDEHYSGIQGVDQLEHLVMVSVLSKTSIASLIQIDLNKIKDGLSEGLLKSLQVSDNSIKGLFNNL